jgi:hypothetical protein
MDLFDTSNYPRGHFLFSEKKNQNKKKPKKKTKKPKQTKQESGW